MSGSVSLKYHLIPDGINTIVQFEVGGDFVVPSSTANRDAKAVLARMMARVTGRSEEDVAKEWAAADEADLWLGDRWRSDELPGGGT